jgi:ABC-type uncharacterized transport system substrate-binding protein
VATGPEHILRDLTLRASNLFAPALAAALLSLLSSGASAHPHVWVTVKATVLYDKGAISGLRQAWTFDEFYTAQAIEGLDKNKDGTYSREELAELAQVNIDGLKEFDYFTYAKLADADRKFKPPVDYWLEHTDKGVLTLHFTLPLQQPIGRDAGEFTFSVTDPSYFIAFEFAEDHPVKLGSGAPAGCTAVVQEPPEEVGSDAQNLSQAFSSAMGNAGTVSLGSFQSVHVHCAKT